MNNSMVNSVNLRMVALDIVMEVKENNEFFHLVMNQALLKYQYLDKNQRAFISRLARGTIERGIELDYIINQYSKTPTRKMKPLIRNLLELSVYQIMYLDSVPDSAACNEAVKIATKRGFSGLKGFVNGVLRNISRNKNSIEYPDKKKDEARYLSVMYSMPTDIIDIWRKIYDFETIEAILKAFQMEQKTFIRCNTSKISVNSLIEELQREGVKVERVAGISYALSISGYDSLQMLESFNDGHYAIQDISSMMAGENAPVEENSFVIDICAAPGGKSSNIYLKMLEKQVGNRFDYFDDLVSEGEQFLGKMISRDVSDYKADLLQDNFDRLGLSEIQVEVFDATDTDEENESKVDIVIADIPCSGLGIIGRKPDIKYNFDKDNMKELYKLQENILNNAVRLVKTGGYLMYSTCTINSEENEKRADWICKEYAFEKCGEYLQILPGKDGFLDGFFVARLKKL